MSTDREIVKQILELCNQLRHKRLAPPQTDDASASEILCIQETLAGWLALQERAALRAYLFTHDAILLNQRTIAILYLLQREEHEQHLIGDLDRRYHLLIRARQVGLVLAWEEFFGQD